MGIMCSSEDSQNNSPKIRRKVTISARSTKKSQSDEMESKIILQSLKNKISGSNQNPLKLSQLEIVSELSQGGQADLFQVKFNSQNGLSDLNSSIADKTFVLRRVYKANQINKPESLDLAKQIMLMKDCPFLMKGIMFTEDQQYTYQVMQNAKGGDLSTYSKPNSLKNNCFKQAGQEALKFIIGGVVLGLENLHKKGIVYCDLKLQNVVIGSDGYPILIDFDMAQKGRFIKSKGFRGTSNYIAPQLFIDDQVDHGMDIWALGVFIYTLIYGEAPYSKQEILNKNFPQECIKNQNNYKPKSKNVSKQLIDLVNCLLKMNPRQRLGYCNIKQIKGHSFFKGFDWFKYQKKQLVSPMIKIFEQVEQAQQMLKLERAQHRLRKQSFSKKRKQSADRETECDQFVEQLNY